MNQPAARLLTGVPGLDLVVGGGLLPGALVFLIGAPGAGKTVMAQQIGFHTAGRGEQVLYFTTLSEPHTKMITHIQGFAFYDASLVGDRLHYINLEQVLRQGAEETADVVVQMARERRAALVVVDGFSSLLAFVNNPAQVREFLYQLSAKLAVLGTSALVTMEAEPRDPTLHMEMTASDTIIALYHQRYRSTHRRVLEVVKARGSKPMAGYHSLVIGDAGETVYPQAELLPIRPAAGIQAGRMPFGISALDAMLDGGLTEGSSTVLAGGLGAGKTLAGLTWLLAGAARNEPGLLLGFHESAAQLLDMAERFGKDLAGPVAAGTINLWTQPAVAIDANQLAGEVRRLVEAHGTRRLVIDSAHELEHLIEPERVHEYLTALIAYLRGESVTVLLTKEVSARIGMDPYFTDTPSALLAENVMLLQREHTLSGDLRRIAVLKMRFSRFDAVPHSYEVTDSGLGVGAAPELAKDDFEEAAARTNPTARSEDRGSRRRTVGAG